MSIGKRSVAATLRATPLTALMCATMLVAVSFGAAGDIGVSRIIAGAIFVYLLTLLFALPVMLVVAAPAQWLVGTLFETSPLIRAGVLILLGAAGGAAVGHLTYPMTGSYRNDLLIFGLSGVAAAVLTVRSYSRLEQGTHRA